MARTAAGYVIEHVKEDLAYIKDTHGKNVSIVMGEMLGLTVWSYRGDPFLQENPEKALDIAILTNGEMLRSMEKRFNLQRSGRPIFHETVKATVQVAAMALRQDTQGLEQVLNYANWLCKPRQTFI